MFTFIINSSLYSILIIYSFNLLPYKWLCDYNSDNLNSSSQKKLSLPRYFLPVFLYTTINLFIILSSSHSSHLQVFTQITMIFLLAHISISDILYMIIPDQHILLIFILGLLNISSNTIWYKLIGILAGALPFYILLTVGLILKKEEWIGFGDIKLMSALGFLLGYTDILNIYVISSLLSTIWIIILLPTILLTRKNNAINHLPFAPFISLASIFCMLP